jgi:hypothetical protein
MTFPAAVTHRPHRSRSALITGVAFGALLISGSQGSDLKITSIVPRSGSNLMISWEGAHGLGRYQLQTSTNGRDWHDAENALEGATNRTVSMDGKSRFYRMRLVPDTTAPTTPANLLASPNTDAVVLSWNASVDSGGAGLWGYALMRNGAMLEFLQGSVTRFTDSAVTPGQTYTYSVHSIDSAGNWSGESAPAVAVVPLAPDRSAPAVPSGVTATTPNCSQVKLSWNPSSDGGGSGVRGYRIYFGTVGTNLVQEVLHPTTTFTHSGRTPLSIYIYTVAAFDHAGNESPRSAPVAARPPACPDVTPPAVTLLSPAHGGIVSQPFTLDASASDDVGVARVEFYRDAGIALYTTSGANYSTTIDPRTLALGPHGFYAKAFDAASNVAVSATNFVVVTNIAASVNAPELMGFLPGIGAANEVKVVGSTAYVASGLWGLSMVDVRNQAKPVLISSVDVPFDGQYVAVSGSLACVTGDRTFFSTPMDKASANGFYVVDLSAPGEPIVRGRIESDQISFLGVAMQGTYAYVACGLDGVAVIDISNPSAPTIVATHDTPGWAVGVVVQAGHLFVVDGSEGLRILDISNPRLPLPLDPGDPSKGALAVAVGSNAQDVTVVGNYAYLAAAKSFDIIDISNRLAPRRAGSYELETPYTALRVSVQGNLAYVATSVGGLVIFDITNAARPEKLSEVAPSGGWGALTVGVAALGSYAYVANGAGGLAVVSVSNPSAPTMQSTFRNWFEGRQSAASANLAVVTGVEYWEGGTRSTNGIRILNIQDPRKPRLVGRIDSTLTTFLGVTISGNYAYVACGDAGLGVVDLRTPGAPVLTTTYNTPGWASQVAVQGTYAFVADGQAGLRILDISNPGSPRPLNASNARVGTVTNGANMRDVFVSGNFAYLATGKSFLIVDVSNKNAPIVRGTLSLATPLTALRSVVHNGYAYIGGSASGLITVDVRNPAAPVLLGSLAPSGSVGALTVDAAISGSIAFVSNGRGGVAVVDIASPAQPRLLHSVTTLGGASEINLIGNWLFVGDNMAMLNTINLNP